MHESEKQKVNVMSLSHVRFFTNSWTAAYQVPLTMGFSRQEYWSGVPLPSPELPGNPLNSLDEYCSGGDEYLVKSVPEELWAEVCNIAQEAAK